MRKQDFNHGWSYAHLGEKELTPVSIPHDAMLGEPKSEIAAGGKNTGWYEGFDYVYEKRFTPDETLAARVAVLEFEGVYRCAEVWLDGEKLSFRPYGYTNFYVDLTGKLTAGKQSVLQVICRNADQPNSRWYSGAGLYRPVWLWTAPKAHIQQNGLTVRTLSIDPPTVEVKVKTNAPGDLTIRLYDETRTILEQTITSPGTAILEAKLHGAKLWSPDSPALYGCRAEFGDDAAETTFGIRELTWGDEGLKLNGERLLLEGACIHHDNGVLGACCYPDAVERKVRILKENGYNALRSAHNPCSKALLDVCDRLGVLVMDEYIDHWYIHKTEYDYVGYFMDWWKQDLKDMVEKDYNHPCVVLYSTGNEVAETAQKRGIQLTKDMTDYLHSLDGTRPVTCGVNIFFNFLSSIGFGVYSDDKAKKEAAKAEKLKAAGKTVKKKSVGSEFFNDLAGLTGDNTMKIGATLHGCDVKTRDAFANMDIAGYNYGIYRYGHDLKKYPHRLILGSETFCNDAYRFKELAKKNPRLVGDFVWAGMDYLGEVAIGSWEYSDYAPRFDGGKGWVSAGSGRVDLIGNPLGEAYYTRVALEREKGPYLGVCPVNHTDEKHSPSAWKMSNARMSWSWNGCEGRKANVEVYARAAMVALVVNGRTVGTKVLKNTCLAKFSCTYEPGIIEAISYDETGAEIGRFALQTAGDETVLRLSPEQERVEKGRLAFVRLAYTDENGTVKPLERGMVKVAVTGGKLLGLGSACPYNETGYTGDTTDTYFGEALAVVLVEEDEVRLTATDGVYSAEAAVCGV